MNGHLWDRETGTRKDRRRRGRAGMGMLLVGALTSSGLAAVLTASTAAAAGPVFPDNIVLFPNRDFVTVEGYADHAGETATLTVTRPGAGVIGSAQAVVSGGEVAFEVNHPGGMCWGAGTNVKVTPDIQPGDVVGVSFGATSGGETTTQDGYVTGESVLDGTTLTVTGHLGAGLNRDQTEQRIIEPALNDTVIGRRDIRALPGPVVASDKGGYSSGLVFDGDTFTATYEFDDAATAQIAADATGARLMAWQVADVLGNRQGLTIAEYGELGGPGMGGCPNGPLQSGPAGPTDVAAANVAGGVKLTWKPALAVPGTPAITGYRATAVAPSVSGRSSERVEIGQRIANPAATGTIIKGLSSTEIYDIEVVSVSSVGLTFPAVGAIPVTDISAPTASASPDAGSFRVAQQVTLSADQAGSEIYFTTDGSSPITNGQPSLGATLAKAPIAIPATTTLKFVAIDPSGNLSTIVERLFTITDTPLPATPTFKTTSVGAGLVTLNWENTDSTVTGYGVQVYDAAGTATVGDLLTPTPATAKTMTIRAGLTPDTAYKFTVVAINANGSSPELWFGPLTPQGSVVANAGPDQTVVRKATATTVNLTAAGSTAAAAGVKYLWSQVPTGTSDPDMVTILNGATTATPSFSLPTFAYPKTNKPLTFRLTVTTEAGTKSDEVLVTPQADQVQIGGVRWKSGDLRVDGVGSVVGSTISVRKDGPTGALLGTVAMTAAAAPATGGVFNLRLRTAVANTNPGKVYIESNLGGTAGPFTVG